MAAGQARQSPCTSATQLWNVWVFEMRWAEDSSESFIDRAFSRRSLIHRRLAEVVSSALARRSVDALDPAPPGKDLAPTVALYLRRVVQLRPRILGLPSG
jgi:hypothetical protein